MIDGQVQIPYGSIGYPAFMNQPAVELPLFTVYKPYDSVRPPSTMPDPTLMKKILAKKAVSSDRRNRIEWHFNKLSCRFPRNPLIGIQYNDPFIPALIHRKLFLPCISPPFLRDDPATGGSGYVNRIVHASGIDDHYFICKRKAFQARPDPVFLILCNNGNGDRHACLLLMVHLRVALLCDLFFPERNRLELGRHFHLEYFIRYRFIDRCPVENK